MRVSTSKGNKEYCETVDTVKAAAKKAKFPAFSNPEVYRDFNGFGMQGSWIIVVGRADLCQKLTSRTLLLVRSDI